jgi:segregation and condensation protein A
VEKGTFPLQVEIEGFSGPLDLLCYLVESRQFEATQIKVSDLVNIYGAYLSHSKKVSIYVVAEFLSLAAGLVLEKIMALLPGQHKTDGEESSPPEDPISEEELLGHLLRYRPYREAAFRLIEKKEEQDNLFKRAAAVEEVPSYDLGDLYSLSHLWWQLIAAHSRKEPMSNIEKQSIGNWRGIPAAVPEEIQIDRKIEELRAYLEDHSSLSLSHVLKGTSTRSVLVVTILALLEMARTGLISITQKELFGDVIISSQTR